MVSFHILCERVHIEAGHKKTVNTDTTKYLLAYTPALSKKKTKNENETRQRPESPDLEEAQTMRPG